MWFTSLIVILFCNIISKGICIIWVYFWCQKQKPSSCILFYLSIHPSLVYNCLCRSGLQGPWSVSQEAQGDRVGDTTHRMVFHHKEETHKTIFHTHTKIQNRTIHCCIFLNHILCAYYTMSMICLAKAVLVIFWWCRSWWTILPFYISIQN